MISIEQLKERAPNDTIIGLKGEYLPGTTEQTTRLHFRTGQDHLDLAHRRRRDYQ